MHTPPNVAMCEGNESTYHPLTKTPNKRLRIKRGPEAVRT